ncbi:MAG: hypothetical protein ACI4MJ_03015 [Aristaeellaceae bacterium]
MAVNCTTMLEEQLAVDYGCTLSEVQGREAVFRLMNDAPDKRVIGSDGAMLQAAVYRGKLLVQAKEPMLSWCRAHWSNHDAAWLAEPQYLLMLDRELRQHGQYLADAHHHYIPAEPCCPVEPRFPVRWYGPEKLTVFQGDARFSEALLFDSRRPDMLAVCAMEQETILGMAAATRNSARLWEIGVNVTPEGRGRNVGAYVTAVLKVRVLSMGITPTYATVASHIASQRAACRAGFIPAFYELYSLPMP